MFCNCKFECSKCLNYKHFFCVLSGKCENLYDDFPSRLDLACVLLAYICDAHYDVLFYVRSSVQIVEHYLFERLQKFFLKTERHKFFTNKEFIRKLSQTVNSENREHQVRVGANLDEML